MLSRILCFCFKQRVSWDDILLFGVVRPDQAVSRTEPTFLCMPIHNHILCTFFPIARKGYQSTYHKSKRERSVYREYWFKFSSWVHFVAHFPLPVIFGIYTFIFAITWDSEKFHSVPRDQRGKTRSIDIVNNRTFGSCSKDVVKIF